MTRLCCTACQGLSLTTGGTDHTITDNLGWAWTFEDHPYCGPVILSRDGNPKARQPGSRSRFWPAYEAWRNARKPGPQPVPQPG